MPDPTANEINFFTRTNSAEVGTVWNLVEKRKQEDKALCVELGWGSQSGITGSQQSQHLSQIRETLSSSHGPTVEITSRAELSDISRVECTPVSRNDDTGFLRENEILPDLPPVLSSRPRTVWTKQDQAECVRRPQSGSIGRNSSVAVEEDKFVKSAIAPPQDGESLAYNIQTIIEEESQSDGEDDGISWF
jgi:hypothetical protein